MTMPTIILPADPREVALTALQPVLPALLPGWRCGWRQDQGFINNITPGRFIGLEVLGDIQRSHVHDEFTIALSFWGDGGISDDRMRSLAARKVTGYLHSVRNWRRNSGPTSLPNPFDQSGSTFISYAVMTVLLKGEDQ